MKRILPTVKKHKAMQIATFKKEKRKRRKKKEEKW